MLGDGMSLAAIGRRVGRHESTVAYWVQRHGLRAAGAERHSARGGIARDELRALVEEGLSIAQIAARLDRSKGAVRYWLNRHRLRTSTPARVNRIVATRAARKAGLERAPMECSTHGHTEFVRSSGGYYRCGRCRSAAVSKRRRKIKAILLAEAGGACVICGYDRFAGALEFHHLEPSEKLFELSQRGVTRSLEAARAEASKCVLLCSNCHAEVEGGFATLGGSRPAGLECGAAPESSPG
jgi:Helix-turn-helix domain